MAYGALPTFGQGFMQGYGFIKGLQNQQARLGIQQHQEQRAQQGFEMKQQAFKQAQAEHKQAERQAHLQRELGAAISAYQTGGIEAAQPYWAKARQYSDALPDITTFLAKNYGEALKTADYGLSGKLQLTPTQIADTAHTLFAHAFNKGVGEKTADGSVLTSKRPVRFYPHPDPNLMIPEYEVTRKRPDGTTDTYLAPHTPNRLSTDEEVGGIPIPELVGKVKGLQLLRNAFIEAGGDPAAFQRESADWHLAKGGRFMYNDAGETKPVDYQKLGIQPPTAEAGAAPEFDNTYYKTITRGLQQIHANQTDAYGNPIVLGNAAALSAEQAKVGTQLAQRLEQRYGRRIPAAVVVDAVKGLQPPMTLAQAKDQADTSVPVDHWYNSPDYGGAKNRRQAVKQKAQQLVAQSRQQYQQQLRQVEAELARAYGGGAQARPRQSPQPTANKTAKPKRASYKTADQVRAAYQAGQLSQAAAAKILRQQFGMH